MEKYEGVRDVCVCGNDKFKIKVIINEYVDLTLFYFPKDISLKIECTNCSRSVEMGLRYNDYVDTYDKKDKKEIPIKCKTCGNDTFFLEARQTSMLFPNIIIKYDIVCTECKSKYEADFGVRFVPNSSETEIVDGGDINVNKD